MTLPVTSLLRDVCEGWASRPGRTGFALFAMAAGVAVLSVLIAILGGLQNRSQAVVRDLGANVVAVLDGQDNPGRLGPREVDILKRALDGCDVSAVRRHSVQAAGDEQRIDLVGTDERLLRVRQWTMQAGRWLDRRDVEDRERHAVLTDALSRRWQRHVGDTVLLERTAFRIIGIVRGAGTFAGQTAFVPGTITPYWDRRAASTPTGLSGVFVRAGGSVTPERMERTARRVLNQPGLSGTDLEWITPEFLLQGVRKLQWTVRLSAGSVAVLCLALGGTTLMSLMVANVRERVPEIGLRLALGATRRQIASLFVVEACGITVAAAALGIVAAQLILRGLAPALALPLDLGPAAWIIPLAAAPVLGGLFAYWPVRIATAVRPASALRNP